jgi:hypothetical protein
VKVKPNETAGAGAQMDHTYSSTTMLLCGCAQAGGMAMVLKEMLKYFQH